MNEKETKSTENKERMADDVPESDPAPTDTSSDPPPEGPGGGK